MCLTIFAGVFLIHEARKRQRTKAEALAVAAEAAQARARSAELERLMMVRMPLTPSRSFVAPQFLATCRCGTFNRRSKDGFGPKSCRVKRHLSLHHPPWV